MIAKIKEWFFYRDFTVKDNMPESIRANINKEQNICILYDGTTETDRKSLHRFKKLLNGNGTGNRNIKSLAFIDNALPLDNVDYAAYNHKNIKWHGVPFGEKVEEFINLPSDILIVLCKNMLPHFEYIVAHSSTDFIVGPFLKKSEKYFNLIVETENMDSLEKLSQSIIKGIDKIAVK